MFFTPTNWMNVWTRGFTPVSYRNLKMVIRKNSQMPVKVKKKKSVIVNILHQVLPFHNLSYSGKHG